MADRVPLLIDYGHAKLAGRMPRARRRQGPDQPRVQCAEAMRLSGPLRQTQQGEQWEVQVRADEQAGTPRAIAGIAATGAITYLATWTATPAATAIACGVLRWAGPLRQPRDRPFRKGKVRPDGQACGAAWATAFGARATAATVIWQRPAG